MKNILLTSLSCCLLFVAAKAQVNLSQGLVAYYPFNGNADDLSGLGNHGQLMNGVSLTSDRNGTPNSAFSFDGIDDYIRIPNSASFNPSTAYSIVLYFSTESLNGQTLVGKIGYNTGVGVQFQVAFNFPPVPGVYYGVNSLTSGCASPAVNASYANTGNPVLTNRWYCVVATIVNGIQSIYLDGVLVETVNAGFVNLNQCAGADIQIGSWWSGDRQQFKGKIDEVRFYNRALTQDEVSALCIQNVSSLVINSYTPALALDVCNNELTVENAAEFKTGDTVLLIQMKGAIIDTSNTSSFGSVIDYKSAGNYEYNYVASITGNIVRLRNILLRQYDIPHGAVQLIRVPYFLNYTNNNELTCLPWDGRKGGVLAFNVQNLFTINQNLDVSGKGLRGGRSINSQLTNWQPFCQSADYFYPSSPTRAQEKGEGIASLSPLRMSGRGRLANGGGGGNLVNSGGGGGSNATTGGRGGDQFQGCSGSQFQNGGVPGLQLSYSSTQNRIFMGGGGGAGDANDPFGSASFNPNGGNGGGIILIKAGQIINNGFIISANGNGGQICPFNCNEAAGGGGAGGTVLIDCDAISSPLTVSTTGGKGADNTSVFVNGSLQNHGPGGGGSGGVAIFRQPALPPNVTILNSGGANGISLNNNTNWGAQPGSSGVSLFNFSLPFSNILFQKNISAVSIQSSNTGCNTFSFSGNATTLSSPIASWFWDFANGTTASSQNTTQTFVPPTSYNVKLVAMDSDGCKDSSTVVIPTVMLPPAPTVNVSQPTCNNPTGSITVLSPIDLNFQYSIDGISYQSTGVFTGVLPGSYNVTVRNTVSRCISQSISAVIQPAPNAPASPTVEITQPTCTTPNGRIRISSPSGVENEYSLNGGSFQSSATFDLLTPGNYQIRTRNTTTLCVSLPTTVSINPVPNPPPTPLITGVLQPTCTLSTGSFSISSPVGTNLLYSIDGINFQSSPIFSRVPSGSYNVIVSNSATGCLSASQAVTILPVPVSPRIPSIAILQRPTCIPRSGSLQVTEPTGNNLEFSIGNNRYQSSPIFNNLDARSYEVTVRDKTNGCLSAPTIIDLKQDGLSSRNFFVPNAFTPNGDGLNDCFGVSNWGLVEEFNLVVYNRWGQIVFQTINPTQCWDGNYNKLPSAPGNYVYVITANSPCGKVERKGNLALIR